MLHRLLCPHKDVHQLPPPESLKLCDWTLTHGEKLWHPWTEATIQHRRMYSLSYLLPIRMMLQRSSAPTLGIAALPSESSSVKVTGTLPPSHGTGQAMDSGKSGRGTPGAGPRSGASGTTPK